MIITIIVNIIEIVFHHMIFKSGLHGVGETPAWDADTYVGNGPRFVKPHCCVSNAATCCSWAEQLKLAQVLGPLPPTWKTGKKLLVVGFLQAQGFWRPSAE